MRLGEPELIWIFIVIPLLVLFYRWSFRRKRKLQERFADTGLWVRIREGVSTSRQRMKPVIIILAVALLLLCLLQPRWGYHWEDITRRGVDVIVAVDTSRSMLAADVKPSRLARARMELEDLLPRLKGDRVGLVAFSGTAFTLCPLTTDYGAFRMFVNDLSTESVSRGGTDLAAAIDRSIAAFEAGPGKYKVLVLISDGENLQGDYLAAAREAEEKDIRIFTVGIGSSERVPIKIETEKGSEYLKDREGNIVTTGLKEQVLAEIATTTGGAYQRATASGLGLASLYRERIEPLEKKELESTRKKIYEQRYQWPLALALLLLMAETAIGEGKSPRRRGKKG